MEVGEVVEVVEVVMMLFLIGGYYYGEWGTYLRGHFGRYEE